jgi:hypothetical protein
VRKPDLQGEELPEHEHCWDEVNPYQNKVLVINADEHGVNAMRKSKFVIMCSNSILSKGIDVYIADVNLALMVVNIVNLLLIICHLVLIDLKIYLILVFFLLPLLKVCNTLPTHLIMALQLLLLLVFLAK